MTAGSVAGVSWCSPGRRSSGLAAFYALWIALGLVMADGALRARVHRAGQAVPVPAERRRAMTAMTLVAALASFIFLPLAQALIDAHGWRDAL